MAYDRYGESGAMPRSVFWLLAMWVILVIAALVWGVDNAETTLRSEARTSLEANGHNVAVDFSGRDARLIGVVESEAVAEQVADTVDAVDGVRLVKNEIVVEQPEPPPLRVPELAVSLVGDVVVVRGVVPSDEVAASLVDAAAEAYGQDRVVNGLEVGANVEPDTWLGFAPGVFEYLPELRSGGFTADRDGLTVTGEVVSQVVRDQLVSEIEVAMGDQIPVTADLTIAVLPSPSFAGERTGGILILDGTMPNQDTIDRILDAAGRLHPSATIVNAMTTGDVAGPMWLESIEGLLDIVSRLEVWTIEVADGTVAIGGLGGDPDVVSAVDVLVVEVVAGELDIVTAVEVAPEAVAAQLTDLAGGVDLFEPGTANLTADGRSLFDTVIGILERNPSSILVVEAHTDGQGNADANLVLSQQRADVVVAYLVSAGIDPERLTATGFGEQQPLASDGTEEGRARNRRIVFVVTEGDT